MRAPGWPASLTDGPVAVRPLRLREAATWVDIRLRNGDWLAPWEATAKALPATDEAWARRQTVGVYIQMVRRLRQQARVGQALPFAVTFEGRLVGQITVSTIVRGALNSGHVGYWVDRMYAGRGITPTALALVVDHSFTAVALHRLEAHVRPENTASRRVVEKLGFREEGFHRRYLAIGGAYRDHISYAITTEDAPEGLLNRWHSVRAPHS
ncbi:MULTISPECIES: GNAT family N-acetyltransferase [unclassified Frankia]|uniref:GNAT family N-acetyltransferase n=1 Tax=unclassified Frankia TaxID=2632575 RepID=UPI0020258E2B